MNAADGDVEVREISPMAWRLLRTAAGYEQREVERTIDDAASLLTSEHIKETYLGL